MAERLKAAVLKIASRVIVTGVRIPLPPFFIYCPGVFTNRGCCSGKAVAHEAVDNYCEPTQPNPGYNEAAVVRSVRPKGKKSR